MTINFFKYQGTGNDFIIIDNRENKISLNEFQIKYFCDRRFGVGADGLMLLENHAELDFNMVYYNSDGNESTMCGNGGRCIVDFANKLGIFNKKTSFSAIDGIHKALINVDHSVSLQMQDVVNINIVNTNFFLNTGSPHYVTFRDKVKEIDVYSRGKEIRYSNEFAPDGTNVNFVEFQGDKIFVRTYERGVENETLSCGTGVTASAIAASLYSKSDRNSYDIITLGGNLHVSFTKENNNIFKDIWLSGPATLVYSGEINI
jgi:diaminopimelate epimerase